MLTEEQVALTERMAAVRRENINTLVRPLIAVAMLGCYIFIAIYAILNFADSTIAWMSVTNLTFIVIGYFFAKREAEKAMGKLLEGLKK